MAFNVNRFISHFDSHAGYARTSKFEVRIALPERLVGAGSMEELSLQCEAAELPGYTVNTVESKIFGAPTYIAGTPAFGDISLTFICAGDLWEKKFFDAWLDLIIPKNTYLVKYKKDYQTNITIHQFSDYSSENYKPPNAGIGEKLNQIIQNNPNTARLADSLLNNSLSKISNVLNKVDAITNKPTSNPNMKGTETYSCKLVNAFPVTVNAMPLNWANDDIHKLTVVFKYDKWLNTAQPEPLNLAPTQQTPGQTVDLDRKYKGVVLAGELYKALKSRF